MEIIKNNHYEMEIQDIGVNGEGIGKIDNFTVFVENAIPKDIIEVRIVKLKKNYAYGKIINIIKSSPYRLEPICKYFKQCGGCNLQHINYPTQLNYKKNMVFNNLKRIGGLDDIEVKETLGMDYPFNYRNKAQFPVGLNNGILNIGFYAARSHNIVDIDDCIIQSSLNKEIIKYMRNFIIKNNIPVYNETNHTGIIRHILTRVGYVTGEIMICIVVNAKKFNYKNQLIDELKDIENLKSIVINYNTEKTNVILGSKVETIYGSDTITDYIGDLKFKISALSFYQVNPVQMKVLYDTVLDYANLSGNETVIDAYCGIGTISLFLAQKAKKVYSVEIINEAIEDAKVNADINNIKNVEFIVGKSEEVIPDLYNNKNICADVIVIDPPRKGCNLELLDIICHMKPKKIIYVSCDSSTLARDLKTLCSQYYQIEKVQPVDMFCNTCHVETVALLSLKTGTPKIEVTMELDCDSNYSPEEKATYQKIKEYVKNKYGVNVHTRYIAEVKRMCGIDMGVNYNKSKKDEPDVKHCPQEKVEYIKEVLKYFGVL